VKARKQRETTHMMSIMLDTEIEGKQDKIKEFYREHHGMDIPSTEIYRAAIRSLYKKLIEGQNGE